MKIPGGQALVGTKYQQILVDSEGPPRKKRLKPFLIERGTVTNAQFRAFVEDTGFVTEAERLGDSFVFEGHLDNPDPDGLRVQAAPWWRPTKGATWKAIHGPGSERTELPDHPVTHVSWNDAQAYAKWAGGRLPTEAEWEHAARGGLGDVKFPWGDKDPNDTDHFPCNIWQGQFPQDDTAADGYSGTAPAISYEPNGYGLYNMVGNVWEWTSERFKIRSLKKAAKQAHAGKDGWYVTKGGSFMCHISYCYRYRIAARSSNSPDSTTSHQGFRLVYDLD